MTFLQPYSLPSKRIATGLALFTGWVGLHRFYLRGARDRWAWVHCGMGLWVLVALWFWITYGQYSVIANVLAIVSGFYLAAVMLQVLLIGLTSSDDWKARFGQHADGQSDGLLVLHLILALMLGTITFFFSLSLWVQRSFEN